MYLFNDFTNFGKVAGPDTKIKPPTLNEENTICGSFQGYSEATI